LNGQRARLVDEIYCEALALHGRDRLAFLDARCAGDDALRLDVEVLLAAAESQGDPIDERFGPARERLWRALLGKDGPQQEDLSDQRINRWRIVERISRGGLATVYRARRDDGEFEQTVAFKVLRRGLDTDDVVSRFRAERQILSSLEHPSIARILDGGALPDGRPFLVLEFVNGVPITDYCAARELDVHECVRLLIDVLRALHHAHTHLVVHRDVKPSNILVTDRGHVVLLDFGIAKLLDAEGLPGASAVTRAGVSLLTPGYASPEQVAGRTVTTASDIYQAGLVLYEVLTGTRSAAAGARGPDTPLQPPSHALRGTARFRQVRGDLDAIVRKATHPDPGLRYASADEMVHDLQHYLEGRPVLAQPDTLGYRLRKLRSRKPWLVPLAAAVLFGVLAYVVTLTVYSQRLQREKQLAAATQQFMVDLFRSPDPYAPADPQRGLDITVVEALQIGLRRLRHELRDQPELRASLLGSISSVYASLDQYREAIELGEEALALERTFYGPDSPRLLESIRSLGRLYDVSGDMDRAEGLLMEQLALAEARFPARSTELALARIAAGLHEDRKGDFEASRSMLLAGIETLLAGQQDHAQVLIDALITLEHQRPFTAEPLPFDPVHEAERIALSAFGADSLQAAVVRVRLASSMTNRSEFEASEQNFLAAIPVLEAKLGKDHGSTISALNNLGYMYHGRMDLEGAERVHRELLSRNLAKHGAVHRAVADSYQNLGSALTYQGRYKESIPLHRKAYDIFRTVLNDDNHTIAIPLLSLAYAEMQHGDLPGAEAAASEALDRFVESVPGTHLEGVARCLLGLVLERQGRNEEGTVLVNESHALIGRVRMHAPYPELCRLTAAPAP
jgi:eukaryotic-like serine/threonine-protein kinase